MTSSTTFSGCLPAFDSYSNPSCEFTSTVDVGASWDPLTASLVVRALIHGLPGKQCMCLTERVMRYQFFEERCLSEKQEFNAYLGNLLCA